MDKSKTDGGQEYRSTFGLSGEIGDGMMLRDWFAGQALASLLRHDPSVLTQLAHLYGVSVNELIATGAYQIADAMLDARKQEGE